LSNITAIAAGRTHSLALRSNGTVAAWGGVGTPRGYEVPMTALSNVVAISAGEASNLALRKDGTVVDWPDSRIPVPLSNVVAVATGAGSYAPCLALKRDSTLVQWGAGGLLQPVPVGLTNVVAIAAGGGHCLALREDNTVVGWGNNNLGQATGTPASNAPYRSEGVVTLQGQTLTNVIAIAAGSDSSLALKGDGTVVAWGYLDHRPSAVPAGLRGVVAIAAAENFCLAITTNAAPFALKR
jgi:alpha-tubulin suppressor-like RCC1 family protein